jgi:putative exporter of polyketide antibiotics
MRIFGIKKDINKIEETGKKIEEKYPLFVSIIKSFLLIIKWIIILFVIIFIFFSVIKLIDNYIEKQEEAQKRKICEEECINSEEERCYLDCLGLPSFKLPSFR